MSNKFICEKCGVTLYDNDIYFFLGRLMHQSGIHLWSDIGLNATIESAAQRKFYDWVDAYVCEKVCGQLDIKDLKAYILRKRIEDEQD